MAKQKSAEFKQEAVRLALSSGLPTKQVASDLGIGLSTLSRWISEHRKTSKAPQGLMGESVEVELARLRKENRILKEEREILKKATQFFASQK